MLALKGLPALLRAAAKEAYHDHNTLEAGACHVADGISKGVVVAVVEVVGTFEVVAVLEGHMASVLMMVGAFAGDERVEELGLMERLWFEAFVVGWRGRRCYSEGVLEKVHMRAEGAIQVNAVLGLDVLLRMPKYASAHFQDR